MVKYIILHFLYNLAELVEKFQLALHRHYESVGQSLYRSDDMQALCETCAPHLFYILISTIVSADRHAISERHSHSQQQRIVALLHKLPTCLKFCIRRIKNYCILGNLQNFHVSFILTVSAVTGKKQPLFLSMITG